MTQEMCITLLSSLRQAQAQSANFPSIGYDSSEQHVLAARGMMAEQVYQVSPNSSTIIISNDATSTNYRADLQQSVGNSNPSDAASFLSYPALFKSSNPSQLTSKAFAYDGPYFHGNNLSLGMILTMTAMNQVDNPMTTMNQVDNPFEPRPIHPSMETKVDSFGGHLDANQIPVEVRATYRRRMSVEHILGILNDIPPIDDDDSLFHPSILSSSEGIATDSFIRPYFENDDNHCGDTNRDSSTSRLAVVSESSNNVTNSAMNLPEDSSRSVDCDNSKEHSSSKPEVENIDVGETTLDHLPPFPHLVRLSRLMSKSRRSQNLLQEWDKNNGLPRSHCCTMMHTNRSRRQLEEGRILPKWNGAPLIRKGGGDEPTEQRKSKKIKKDHAVMKP